MTDFTPDYPDAWKHCVERIEMLRQAAVRILKNPTVLPEQKRWALFYAPMLPLGRPLSDGCENLKGTP